LKGRTVDVEVIHDQVDGLGLGVLQRQFTGDSRELEGGTVGCREREMAARLRLYGAENIGRAAAFVLVVAPRFAPRFGGRGRANLGMQRDRLLVQAHHWFGWIVRCFVSLQHVFHLGDVLVIEFGHAPHFFPATA
jgi:hypothetical protein